MAPVPIEHPPSYIPLAVSTAHLGLVVYLTYAVGASLYTSYKSLSPSQDTRNRLERRVKLSPVFLGLAGLAFAFASYSSASYVNLSYRVWADKGGYELPQRFVGDKGFFPGTQNSSQLYLRQWLHDTPIYYDALEIVAEKARRFWWGQQVDLATVSWSMLLAIEGRRRRIPLLSAFMALAHLVNLSFAQNLFYLALLLTPAPIAPGDDELELPVAPVPTSIWVRIRDTVAPPKPINWCPHPALFVGPLLSSLGAVFALPYVAESSTFRGVALFARASTFLPLLLPKIIPVSWGTVHPHPHNAYSAFTRLFQLVSFGSFVLHAKASVLGIRYNTPDSHYHRHSRFLPWDVDERSAWEQSITALGKVLGSTADHPAVAAVGYDAILCALSLGIWAAVRATDVQDIIMSAVPFYGRPVTSATSKSKPPPRAAIKAEAETDAESTTGSVRSRRGRPKKKVAEAEQTYEPTAEEARRVVEGDILPLNEVDWESAALAWGLAAFGGLGSASAGVYGGECVSR